MTDISIRQHVLKNGKVSYEYRFDIASEGGKRKQCSKSGFKTKVEAKRAGWEAQQKYEGIGRNPNPTDISYSDFLDAWMEEDCKIDLKPSTIQNYQKKIKNHIKPALGHFRLKAIAKSDLQMFILDMYNNGYSVNTLTCIIGVLSKSFNYAVDNHYINHSPAIRLKIPKNRAPKTPTRVDTRESLPPTIITLILQRFPETHPSHIPLRLGYECGLRIGETFALTWEDINLDAKTLTVNRQVQWQEDGNRTLNDKITNNGLKDENGYWFFTNPKYNSFRTIDLSDDIVCLLLHERQRQEAMKAYYGEYYTNYYATYPLFFGGVNNPKTSVPNPIKSAKGKYEVHFLCVRKDGTYISLRTMQHTARVIHKDIFPSFKYHSLRHTHATLLYSARLPDKYISARLGHKDCKITKDIYIHLDNITKAEGRQGVNALFTVEKNTD